MGRASTQPFRWQLPWTDPVRQWLHRGRRTQAWALGMSLLITITYGWSRGAKGENVHRWDANCTICHTGDQQSLQSNPASAKVRLRSDLESVCNGCHGDQGASHPTGMKPKMTVPGSLPLSADGKITCSTCHFMHGEDNRFGDFVRIDNRRGGLCLSCHKMSELE